MLVFLFCDGCCGIRSLWLTSGVCCRKRDSPQHCRIRSKQERGQTKYYLIDNLSFDSLYNLITHYRSHPLRSTGFAQTLTGPVPQPQSHEGKE